MNLFKTKKKYCKNKLKVKIYNREYYIKIIKPKYDSDPEFRQRKLDQSKKDWEVNHEKLKPKRKLYLKEYKIKNKELLGKKRKIWHDTVRMRVLLYYSKNDLKCVCCNERTFEFLSLDHINGGGGKERKQNGSGTTFLRWLEKNNYPTGYQILCHNCNQAKGHYGICPHKKIGGDVK